MWLKLCREMGDTRSPPRPALKKVTVTDGPFAETKELVLGTREDDVPLATRQGCEVTMAPLRISQAADVIAGGVIAGTLDIVYACAFWALKAGIPARRIFQSVAAGLLGQASFEGGLATAALGLLLHYGIATTMSLVYYLAAGRYPLLVRRPVFAGAIYGLVLYGAMNYVVVPLSAAGPGSKDPLWITLSILVHMFLIGVPIALIARVGHVTRATLATEICGRRTAQIFPR